MKDVMRKSSVVTLIDALDGRFDCIRNLVDILDANYDLGRTKDSVLAEVEHGKEIIESYRKNYDLYRETVNDFDDFPELKV